MSSSKIRAYESVTMSVINRNRRPFFLSKNSKVVRVVPRKKTVGTQKIERNCDCVEVSIDTIKELAHLSQTVAAMQLVRDKPAVL